MKLLLYCVKAKPYLVKVDDNEFDITNDIYDNRIQWDKKPISNGKIVAECDFEVEKLQIVYGKGWETKTIKGTENIEKLTCIDRDVLYQYCKGNGYTIHIKNLHIFDEPRELSEFDVINFKCIQNYYKSLEKAPQNMMYVYDNGEKKILISIQPQWLCKILNNEKTIEVRKKVLREML